MWLQYSKLGFVSHNQLWTMLIHFSFNVLLSYSLFTMFHIQCSSVITVRSITLVDVHILVTSQMHKCFSSFLDHFHAKPFCLNKHTSICNCMSNYPPWKVINPEVVAERNFLKNSFALISIWNIYFVHVRNHPEPFQVHIWLWYFTFANARGFSSSRGNVLDRKQLNHFLDQNIAKNIYKYHNWPTV